MIIPLKQSQGLINMQTVSLHVVGSFSIWIVNMPLPMSLVKECHQLHHCRASLVPLLWNKESKKSQEKAWVPSFFWSFLLWETKWSWPFKLFVFFQMGILLIETCCDLNIRNWPSDRDAVGGGWGGGWSLEGEKGEKKKKKGRKDRTQDSIVFSSMESSLLGLLLCSVILENSLKLYVSVSSSLKREW